jgi:hypothetical protein
MEYLEEQTVQSTDTSKSPKLLLLFLGGARTISTSRSRPRTSRRLRLQSLHVNVAGI